MVIAWRPSQSGFIVKYRPGTGGASIMNSQKAQSSSPTKGSKRFRLPCRPCDRRRDFTKCAEGVEVDGHWLTSCRGFVLVAAGCRAEAPLSGRDWLSRHEALR